MYILYISIFTYYYYILIIIIILLLYYFSYVYIYFYIPFTTQSAQYEAEYRSACSYHDSFTYIHDMYAYIFKNVSEKRIQSFNVTTHNQFLYNLRASKYFVISQLKLIYVCHCALSEFNIICNIKNITYFADIKRRKKFLII